MKGTFENIGESNYKGSKCKVKGLGFIFRVFGDFQA